MFVILSIPNLLIFYTVVFCYLINLTVKDIHYFLLKHYFTNLFSNYSKDSLFG